jgi:hypothetical protein
MLHALPISIFLDLIILLYLEKSTSYELLCKNTHAQIRCPTVYMIHVTLLYLSFVCIFVLFLSLWSWSFYNWSLGCWVSMKMNTKFKWTDVTKLLITYEWRLII